MTYANFSLVKFSKFSIGSVFPVTTSWVQFQHLSVDTLKTFMHGHFSMTFLHYSKKDQKNLSKSSHIYA